MWKILFAFAFTCFATFAGTAQTPLFDSGRSGWEICISPTASSAEQRAAGELRDYLKKISGAELPINRDGTVPGRNRIIIGTDGNEKNGVENDSFRIRTQGDNLYLTGSNPRSALYAVYGFLEKVCGVHWFHPGAGGEVVPVRKQLVLPVLDMTETAGMQWRGFHLCDKFYDEEMETWMSRNRMNIMRSSPVNNTKWIRNWNDGRIAKGFHMMFSNHNVMIYDQNVFKEHPEYFAEIDGKRCKDQLCWSNPDVDKIMIDRLLQYCREYPEVETISIYPADSMKYCQCAKCRKKTLTNLWFDMFMRLKKGVQAEFPKVKFASIAYQGYRSVPTTDIADTEFIEYCMYNRCYVHNLDNCKMNHFPLEEMQAWRKKNVSILVYGYEFDIFNPIVQVPFYHMLSDQMREFKKIGIKGEITEIRPPSYRPRNLAKDALSPGSQRMLAFYVYARLLWNPDADVEALIREYSTGVYDRAGDAMAEYAIGMSKAWSKMKIHYTYFWNSPYACASHLLNPELVNQSDSLFRKAEVEAVKIKDPKRREQVQSEIVREKKAYTVWKTNWINYRTSSQNNKLMLPLRNNATPFRSAAVIPKFNTRGATSKVPLTEATINWDKNGLYLQVVCHDPNMDKLIARLTGETGNAWVDEALEIFLAIPGDTEGLYRQLVVNPNGTKYSAIAIGSWIFNTDWKADWKADIRKEKDRWTATIAIPFETLGAKPKINDVWQFGIMRTGQGRFPNSGWPNATYHDQNALGLIQFCNISETRSTAFFVRGNEENAVEMKMLLEKAGYQVTLLTKDAELKNLTGDKAVYIIRTCQDWKLDPEPFLKNVVPALKNGALVIVTSWGNLPLEKYFGMPELALKGSGGKIDGQRKAVNVKPGTWQQNPEPFSKLIQHGLTPSSGYLPVSQDGWENLASLKMANGEIYSWLLTRRIGKGLLVVTSGDFGFSGGWAILGRDKSQSVMLVNNMYQLLKDIKKEEK